jgi:hypothetical protein
LLGRGLILIIAHRPVGKRHSVVLPVLELDMELRTEDGVNG